MSEVEARVTAFLLTNHRVEGHDTLTIAKAVFGPDAIQKQANLVLYNMQKRGLVRNLTPGKRGHWVVVVQRR